MQGPRALLLTIIFALTAAVFSSAGDIYLAQSAAGGASGADCADALPVTFFNTAGNWGSGTGKIGAGTTVHLCGTISSGLTVEGSGSSGNVITITWESGARISVPDGQIINVGGNSFLLFDGGTACGPGTACDAVEAANPTGYAAGQAGLIEATANGSALANQNSSTQAFYGCNACHDIEIRNLIIRNLYRHTSTSDSTDNADTGTFAFQYSYGATGAGGTISVHDSTLHDIGTALSVERGLDTTFNFYNLDMYRNNWEIENSGNGTRTMNIYGNHFHDASNWDTSGDSFHHNGLHNYMNVSSDSLGLSVYNNNSDGLWGGCCTTAQLIFVETAQPANAYFFNNRVEQSCSDDNTTYPIYYGSISAGTGASIYNNTFQGCATTGGNVAAVFLEGTGIKFENNAIQNYGQYVVLQSGSTFTTLDYNIYGSVGTSGNSPWQCGATGYSTFAAWQSGCSGDSHGQKVSSLNVNSSTGVPNAGSPLIGAGINLASLNIPGLDSDLAGTLRPSSGAWDVGAYKYGAASAAAPAAPAPPQNLEVTVQ